MEREESSVSRCGKSPLPPRSSVRIAEDLAALWLWMGTGWRFSLTLPQPLSQRIPTEIPRLLLPSRCTAPQCHLAPGRAQLDHFSPHSHTHRSPKCINALKNSKTIQQTHPAHPKALFHRPALVQTINFSIPAQGIGFLGRVPRIIKLSGAALHQLSPC